MVYEHPFLPDAKKRLPKTDDSAPEESQNVDSIPSNRGQCPSEIEEGQTVSDPIPSECDSLSDKLEDGQTISDPTPPAPESLPDKIEEKDVNSDLPQKNRDLRSEEMKWDNVAQRAEDATMLRKQRKQEEERQRAIRKGRKKARRENSLVESMDASTESKSQAQFTETPLPQHVELHYGPRRDGEPRSFLPGHELIGVESRSQEEYDKLEDQEKGRQAERRRSALPAVPKPGDRRMWAFWNWTFSAALVVVVAVLLALFGFAQVATLSAQLASLPIWAAWLFGSALLLLLAILGVALCRLLLLYLRLRAARQVSFMELRERERSRSDFGRSEYESAKRSLEQYVKAMPWDADLSNWPGFEISNEMAKRRTGLPAARSNLLDANQTADSRVWIEKYKSRLQGVLDQIADDRIAQVAKAVAFKTAASPNPIIDIVIMAHSSLTLVGDLCRLYNVRTDNLGTMSLTWRVMFASYVSGRVDEFEDVAAEKLREVQSEGTWESLVGKAGPNMESALGSDIWTTIVGKAGSKAASGVFNYFVMKRLGNDTKKRLQPLRS